MNAGGFDFSFALVSFGEAGDLMGGFPIGSSKNSNPTIKRAHRVDLTVAIPIVRHYNIGNAFTFDILVDDLFSPFSPKVGQTYKNEHYQGPSSHV